jgi:hypothetical protein
MSASVVLNDSYQAGSPSLKGRKHQFAVFELALSANTGQ